MYSRRRDDVTFLRRYVHVLSLLSIVDYSHGQKTMMSLQTHSLVLDLIMVQLMLFLH